MCEGEGRFQHDDWEPDEQLYVECHNCGGTGAMRVFLDIQQRDRSRPITND